ncbi:NADP-dependent oxidoreductase [Zavarzinia sp. CC-PAN008]|uniref:NADP-dependent oxidoreductase n=1 Tax=Zavarzinia sp. CC-PAN008 TaxID=3243332 RepID=UPI003F7498E8
MTKPNDVNRQFRLKSRPHGLIKTSDFDLVTEPVPVAGPGQVVVRTLYLSLDPTNRIWMSDVDQYMPPVAIGEVMRGGGIAQVVESNHEAFRVGDLVQGLTNWQDYAVFNGAQPTFSKLPAGLPVPLPTLMGALGMTGVTAYFGLLECGQPKAGETVVISAAAGAVGSVVGQIAKIKGCRAVGLAGSDEKCRWVVDELGFDACINYKAADWKQQLLAACPNGIDVDFENVGGEIMDFVLANMNLGGRVALCGMISGYNQIQGREQGPTLRGNFESILMKRLNVRGFIVTDFFPRMGEAAGQLGQWLATGKLKSRETIVDGLESAPTAVNRLFEGSNIGKLVVKVADPA